MLSEFYTKYPQVNDEIINLDWLINKIKSMEHMLDEWIAQAEELKQMLLNTIPGMQTDIATLQSQVAAIEQNIADLQQIRDALRDLTATTKARDDDLQNQINQINTSYDDIYYQIDILNSRIDNIKDVVGAEVMGMIHELSVNFYKMKFELEAEMNEIRSRMDEIDTSVYNPWAGRRVDQDENAKLIYADLADNVPTAEEYSELGLSSNDYDAYDLSAYEYAVRGRKHIHLDWVYSPVLMLRQNISNVLTSIINFMLGTLSASEYAALDLTAEEYSNLDLTSEEYYSYNTNESGLSASEYAAISKLQSNMLILKEV